MAGLALNACNVDRVVAEYNVALYQRQEIAAIDLSYLVNELSYDAQDVLEQVPMKDAGLEQAIRAGRYGQPGMLPIGRSGTCRPGLR